jgi:ferredoxin-fold anticodon binding domain-containing protein
MTKLSKGCIENVEKLLRNAGIRLWRKNCYVKNVAKFTSFFVPQSNPQAILLLRTIKLYNCKELVIILDIYWNNISTQNENNNILKTMAMHTIN